MKNIIFVLALCSVAAAQKGEVVTTLPAEKIKTVTEYIVPAKTVMIDSVTDTTTMASVKVQRVIPEHVETNQARHTEMLNLKAGDELISDIKLNGVSIGKLYYKVTAGVAGKDKCLVFKMDVK